MAASAAVGNSSGGGGGPSTAEEGVAASSHTTYASAKRCTAHEGCVHFNRARAAFHGLGVAIAGADAGAGETAQPYLARGWLFGEPNFEAFALEAAEGEGRK